MIADVLWDWGGDGGGKEGKEGEEAEAGAGELHYAPGVMINKVIFFGEKKCTTERNV